MSKTDNQRRRRLVIWDFLYIGLLVLAVICGSYILYHLAMYAVQDRENESIRTSYLLGETIIPSLESEEYLNFESVLTSETDGTMESLADNEVFPLDKDALVRKFSAQPLKKYDQEGLLLRNPDYLFWIDIPGTKISYPVVQSADNVDYLQKTFDGEQRSSGSIFVDAPIRGNVDVENIVIHGHNMKNGSMFGSLPSYRDISYYNQHPFVYLYIGEEVRVYQIISAYSVPATLENTGMYAYSLPEPHIYDEFLADVLAKSYYTVNIGAEEKGQLLTLSTCTNRRKSRFVVHAMRYY